GAPFCLNHRYETSRYRQARPKGIISSMAGTRDARQRILEAAADLVTLGGLAAATPAAIAERAGAGKMSVYRHFSGKDELVAEALARRDLPYRTWLLGDAADTTPRERLVAMFDRGADVADRLGNRFI